MIILNQTSAQAQMGSPDKPGGLNGPSSKINIFNGAAFTVVVCLKFNGFLF